MIKKYHFSIIMAFAFFFLLGLFLTPKLDIQFKNENSQKKCRIAFIYPNTSSRIVENEVTNVIENSLSSIKNIKHITSNSSNGKGEVSIFFDREVDFEQVKTDVFSRLRSIYDKLPEEVPHPEISFSDFQKNNNLIQLSLYSSHKNFDLAEYVDKNIIPELNKISGVYNIENKKSFKEKCILVYDILELQRKGLDPKKLNHQIINDLQDHSIVLDVENQQTSRVINLSDFFTNSVQDISHFFKTYFFYHKDQKIFLKDIAVLKQQQINGNNFQINNLSTLVIDISINNNSNQLTIEKKIFEVLKTIKFPSYVNYLITENTIENIKKEITKVFTRGLLSILILIAVLFISKRSWRLLVMIIGSIIINIVIANIFYVLLGVSIDIYTVASIAICFGLITDNIIIIMSHFWAKGKINREIIVPVLAATCTTVGVLVTVLLVKENLSNVLQEFSWVLSINLLISLAISFLLIPSLIIQFNIKPIEKDCLPKTKQFASEVYKIILIKFLRYKYVVLTLFVLLFGFPTFLLNSSKKFDKEGTKIYDNSIFKNYIKPLLGGSLTYFIENKKQVYDFDYKKDDIRLTIKLHQNLKSTINGLELSKERFTKFLDTQKAIDYYKVNRNSDDDMSIEVFFKKNQNPYTIDHIKRNIEALSLHIDGINISIFGVGNAFGNSASETADGYLLLKGYNIEALYNLANDLIEKHLYKNPKINYVEVNSNPEIEFKKLKEYEIKRKNLYPEDISLTNYIAALEKKVGSEYILTNSSEVLLSSNTVSEIPDMNFVYSTFFLIDSVGTGFQDYFKIKERNLDKSIVRKNKLYQLYLNFSYLGNSIQSKKYISNLVENIKEKLPIGYKVSSSFDKSDFFIKNNQLFLFLVSIIIVNFLICSILFESIGVAFKIIMTIPISFIGIFLTYPLLNIPFDIGGVASFFLISGISANSMIYVYSEFKKNDAKQRLLNNYLKAFFSKIDAIVLTIISTVGGLLPFILFDSEHFFWTSFAYGTIGGILFSLITLLFFFPLTLQLKYTHDSVSN